MTSRPLVTIEEFERIECNRCGECCERFTYLAPIEVALVTGWYARFDPAEYDMREHELWLAWTSHIAPVEGAEIGTNARGERVTQYACDRFARDAAGLGLCTAYNERPEACRSFPNNRPSNFEGCSWNVDIILP